MSQKCDICGKGPMSGNSVSHSHRKTRRKFYPNLHRVTIEENGRKVRKKICTRCLKTMSKAR
ncbi:50S ribosomal protein L28 [bacterium]|nr:50S ribosomal protein L28 [bacterium]